MLSLADVSTAASVDAAELATLRAQAQRLGAAPVLIHLENTTLSRLRDDAPGVRARSAAKSSLLLRQLGANAWRAGRWDNGIGQIGLYITPQGLDALIASKHAVSFFAGKPWTARTSMLGEDGAHAEIERLLDQQGYVDVDALANVDGMDLVHGQDGRTRFAAARQAALDGGRKLSALLDAAEDSEIGNRQSASAALRASAASSGPFDPQVTLRLTRQGLLHLAESDALRSVKPIGFVDRRQLHFDQSALDTATRDGTAEVVLVVRNPHAGGALSKASLDANERANRNALTELLATVGVSALSRDLSRVGAVSARLTADQLTRLRESADRRLLAVVENKPVATTQLAMSSATLNMASAWNAGFRGAGQNVLVFDTGVQANHPFVNGRLAFDACFGTTALANGIQYQSACPQPDANGDSPLGLLGSGAPPFGGACSTQDPGSCSHGTHVAGITSGRSAAGIPAGLQGTAPDSGVMAIQVFSFDAARVRAPTSFFVDLLAALQATAAAVTPGVPSANAFTVNMSLGGGMFAGPCTAAQWTPYITAVQQLRNAGVPVIAATGNDAFDNAISVPACLPSVIKVSAVGNNGVGATRSFFNPTQGANVANPTAFPGEDFWVAPGGGNGTNIQSSTLAAQQFEGFSGTSMAAPQIAGLYATAKAVNPALTVNDVTAWFVGNAGVNVAMTGRNGAALGFNLQRIRLPAL